MVTRPRFQVVVTLGSTSPQRSTTKFQPNFLTGRGLGYFLGIEEGVPRGVVQISKTYINWVWDIREREMEGWKQMIRNMREEEEIGGEDN